MAQSKLKKIKNVKHRSQPPGYYCVKLPYNENLFSFGRKNIANQPESLRHTKDKSSSETAAHWK